MQGVKIGPRFKAATFKAGLSVGVVAAATAISFAGGRMLSGVPFAAPFFFAVFIGVWFGGLAAGGATFVLSVLALHVLSAHVPLVAPVSLVFVLAGAQALAMQRDRAERTLRATHDSLAATVQDLENSTRELSAEIDDRKRAEAMLSRAEERWRRMFEASAAGMALAGPDGVFTAANAAFQKMVGYSEDEIKGRTAVQLNHPDERGATVDLIDEFNQGLRQVYHAEKRYLHKDGSPVWVNVTTTVVPPTETAPPFLQAIYIDISSRKSAEEALRKSQAELARVARLKMMGELTASIAHEVNQPLAAIVASGNACRRWLARDLSRAAESLDHVIEDARRAGEIIQRIRSMTRQSTPERLALDVNDVLNEVIAFTRNELAARGIVLERDLSADALSVLGDRIELQQVVLNLVINAADAMTALDDRPKLLAIVSGRDEQGLVRVDVEDCGIGLDDESRIFEPFYTTKPDGMGLGLSISASIIAAHGGRLWATRRSPYGTAFHFTLPAAETGADA